MKPSSGKAGEPLALPPGAIVAVIGGGPAGAFFALEILRQARAAAKRLNVVIFERRGGHSVAAFPACGWRGCNYCAGGISPKLFDVLEELGLDLPQSVVQSRVETITIQGFWKNIELEVPPARRMLSVFRGSRPSGTGNRVQSFDSFLLEQALAEGATLIPSEVANVKRNADGRVLLQYASAAGSTLLADFCVFACGINERGSKDGVEDPMRCCARALMPGFSPPKTRKTLIFELAARPHIPPSLRNGIFFVEYGSRELPLEMCSILPKRDYITVVLIGPAVDRVHSALDYRRVIEDFLNLSHIKRLLWPAVALEPMCMCAPRMVVGIANSPLGDRVAAVGDFVTSRLYKDGILSAHRTASGLATAILQHGIDANSLREGYEPTLRHFRRNNRFAAIVFFLHRVFFSSSVLSRVLYQAVITERKTTVASRRRLENILWRIASGDDDYEQIFWSMAHPATLWEVFAGGAVMTARNFLTELAFGLRWEGFGRFTTGVSLERLEEKRKEFCRLIREADIALPEQPEFERMYTIKIAAPRHLVLAQLETFGEPDRQYLRPRGLRVTRVAGEPNAVGCVIRYEVLCKRLSFDLRLENIYREHLAVYRVVNGFAKGGVLLFEIEQDANEVCLLSIYVAFDFKRGSGLFGKLWWRAFRILFPSFSHDVLWNHSLCQLRDVIERHMGRAPQRLSVCCFR